MSGVTDARRELQGTLLLVGLFGLVALLALTDLALDVGTGISGAHALTEGALAVLGIGGAAGYARRVRGLAREAQELRDQAAALTTQLAASQVEAARWRADARDLIAGLAAAIDAQLEAWSLTAAEKEVALLLLKGLSHKEIAEVRGVAETTVRQQARAVYKKAGLGGRSDLAAFFLEDLLGPAPRPAPSTRPPS